MTDQAPDPPSARAVLAPIVFDLAWLVGAAEQAGVVIPEQMTDRLRDAVDWLAS